MPQLPETQRILMRDPRFFRIPPTKAKRPDIWSGRFALEKKVPAPGSRDLTFLEVHTKTG